MNNPRITDYSSFVYQLPETATDKDYQKLSSKLKTFVQSSKFLRQGSTVDEYDPQTGKRIKRPISNVIYKESPKAKKGIPAQKLRILINKGIRQNDRKALQRAARYQFFSADRFLTQKQRLQLEDKDKRKRVLLTSLAFGIPFGAGLATVPFLDAKLMHSPIDAKHYVDAAKLAALGLLLGTGTAAMIEGIRS